MIVAIRRPQRACWKLSCGRLGRFPLQRGRLPSCALPPADGPPHMLTLSALHKSDYHSSRQLECFSHIATAPQTQGTSNRANRISSDEPCAGTWRLFLFRFPFLSVWIRANGCWRPHLAQRLDIKHTQLVILSIPLKERSYQVCLSSDVTLHCSLYAAGCWMIWPRGAHTSFCDTQNHPCNENAVPFSYHVYFWSSASTTCSNQ